VNHAVTLTLIAVAATGVFSVNTVSVTTAAERCTSVQARCAIEIGGTCDPQTGKWRYKTRIKNGQAQMFFSDCVLKAQSSGQGKQPGK
jgi:hypothetical protein